ncbi:DUF2163 domain-containing protein [Shimia sp.]|uniref:DUF2163 domain-containing protein n=1 Tax=Shimia sp. TaxID=1954381 RepID=UPI00356B181E
MAVQGALEAHLKTGLTTLARCWGITRSDGVRHGFTDHDRDLAFEGFTFRADTGVSAVALAQSSGLAVDNTEALGALSDAGVQEADIEAGRFDAAAVVCWLVNWAEVEMRSVVFRGQLGEIRRAGGAFEAELRGLTEALNRPFGRVFQKPCAAVLGDGACGFDTGAAGYFALRDIEGVEGGRVFSWGALAGFEPGWFTRGRLQMLSGAGAGLGGGIKRDWIDGGRRLIELWQPLRAEVAVGDRLQLVAGCDKRMETCRLKFDNLLNFRGFPDIPGEDWMLSYPRQDGRNTGGSLR